MPRKPINPSSINWNTIETTLNNGKTNFKILGKATGAVGGIEWNNAVPTPIIASNTCVEQPIEISETNA